MKNYRLYLHYNQTHILLLAQYIKYWTLVLFINLKQVYKFQL